jgi:hypothetical protein
MPLCNVCNDVSMIPKSSTCVLGRYGSFNRSLTGEMNDLNIGVHRQRQARCMLKGVFGFTLGEMLGPQDRRGLQVDRLLIFERCEHAEV